MTLDFLKPWLNVLSYSFEYSYDFGFITSPTITIAVIVIFSALTFSAISINVPRTIFWSFLLALYTTETGVVFLYPPAIASFEILVNRWTLR